VVSRHRGVILRFCRRLWKHLTHPLFVLQTTLETSWHIRCMFCRRLWKHLDTSAVCFAYDSGNILTLPLYVLQTTLETSWHFRCMFCRRLWKHLDTSAVCFADDSGNILTHPLFLRSRNFRVKSAKFPLPFYLIITVNERFHNREVHPPHKFVRQFWMVLSYVYARFTVKLKLH
jgi:hypothetical protein